MGFEKNSDKFNPQAIVLHDDRSSAFKEDYSDDLSAYCSNAFKYGRKKIEGALATFLDNLKAGSRILEVGSGTGYFLNTARQKGHICVGIDLAENMARHSRRAYPD